MNIRVGPESDFEEAQVIATFGEARLVRAEGELQLQGGSMADRMEALEWVSLCMPEEAVRIKR